MTKLRQFEVGNYYHSYSRGVNKCEIFRDHSDYLMFQRMVNIFNTDQKIKSNRLKNIKEGKKLVEVFCYILMPNHFHFILKELMEGGISSFLQWTAIISVAIGFFNLLPIPMLDGGHMALYVLEGIMGRRLPQHVENTLMFIGLIFLLIILVLATSGDVGRLFGK